MREYLELYSTFFRIGLFTFGGGLAMLPLLHRELVDKHGWISDAELLDFYTVSQMTPGVIAINTATFVGARRKGIWGGIFATLGMVTPSLVIIVVIASALNRYAENELVQKAFAGIRVMVVALIARAVFLIGRKAVKGPFAAVLALAVCIGSAGFKIAPPLLLLAVCILGIVYHLIHRRRSPD